MTLSQRFGRARADPALVVLEGFHALKHALRFGAEIEIACTPDRAALVRLAQDLAPDLQQRLESVQEIPPARFAELAPVPPPTGVLAIALRPEMDLTKALSAPAPIVLLEEPVASRQSRGGGAGRGRGRRRGSAGHRFAGPLASGGAARLGRSAFRPAGGRGSPARHRPAAAGDRPGRRAAHGRRCRSIGQSWRSARSGSGLSENMLARAERRIAIPMQPGVSSLNLACAVAVVLYMWRLAHGSQQGA